MIGGCATNTCSVDGIGLSACISTTENAEVCVGSAALAGLCIACTTSDECPTGFICYPGSNRCADPGSCNPVCETTTTSLAAAVDDAASFNVHD